MQLLHHLLGVPSSARQEKPIPVWSEGERARLLADVCDAIREDGLDRAEAVLEAAKDRTLHDPACLNLWGIIHEARGDWKKARRMYGAAMRMDRGYAPAEQNLRRIYEMNTFGSAREQIALGECEPLLVIRTRGT